MRPSRLGIALVTLFLLASVVACGGGGGRRNKAPTISPPMGPGTPSGVAPSFSTFVTVGDPIDVMFMASDPNRKNTLTFTADVTGGGLSGAQAGFSTAFPATTTGMQSLNLSLTGTAANAGQIELTITVDDGKKKTDTITLMININGQPQIGSPTGPGVMGGADPAYTTVLNVGNFLDFGVAVTDVDPADIITFQGTITGGTLSAAQAGFTETFPAVTSGSSPLSMGFTGTAAAPGDILFTFSADDGAGGTDLITHRITINAWPLIGAPSGPGTPSGSDPVYATTINIGDVLDFGITATDTDPTNILTFTVSASGTLTPAQAGFNELLPFSGIGFSPQPLNLTGTAAMGGDITLTFDVVDGVGGTDQVLFAININSPPIIQAPTGPGTISGADPTYTTLVNVGDLLDFGITVSDADATDIITFQAAVTGGSLGASAAGFVQAFPVISSGSSPLSMALTGTAAMPGDIEITISADDGTGAVDLITHTIAINAPPAIGVPSGPGSLLGAAPAYTTTINVGALLDLGVTGTDVDAADTLNFTVSAGGTLTPAQAGFNEVFPLSVTGTSPQALNLTGTAAMAGDIILTFDLDDGRGATDQITLTININTPPVILAPTGPGTIGGADPTYTASLVVDVPLGFSVDASDADGDVLMLDAMVTGGSLTAAQAGINETFPVMVTGAAPQTLAFTGTAAMPGDIQITFTVDDGRGGLDAITHTITILPDTTAPSDIGDVAASYSGTPDTLTLTWTASGDDGMIGTATAYVLKFSTSPILNDADFNAAATYPQTWTPVPAGGAETFLVDLTLVAYSWYSGAGHFAIKAVDEVANSSNLLNPVMVNTDPSVSYPPVSYAYGSMDFGNSVATIFDFSTAVGDLVDFVLSGISVGGDPAFSITGGGAVPAVITPGSTHTVVVQFLPLASGAFAGTLDVTHNDAGSPSPFSVALTGAGVNAPPQVTATGLSDYPAFDSTVVSVTADVFDNNNRFPVYNDIASVTIDLTSVGGPAAQPMAFQFDDGNKTATFGAMIDTTGFGLGVFDLPVTASDAAGASAVGYVVLAVYTGVIRAVPGTYATIQDAINAAINGDVVLVDDGVYSGAGNQDLFTSGKVIIVQSQNGAANAAIDCGAAGRGFFLNNTGETNSTYIMGFTIQNASDSALYFLSDASPTLRDCTLANNSNVSHGGAMVLDGGSVAPLIINCTFSANGVDLAADRGGAIYAVTGAQATIERSTFSGNQANEGGAIFWDGGILTVTDSVFDSNTATASGGAGYLDSGATVFTRCTFDQNQTNGGATARSGGALFIFVTCDIVDCLFTNNVSGLDGGAIARGGAGAMDVSGTDFSGNQARNGAAIDIDACCSTITDCTFVGNQASRNGGGVHVWNLGAGPLMRTCLFAGNSAIFDGGAIYSEGGNNPNEMKVFNCTITSNTAGGLGGGIYVAWRNGIVTDSIIWGNTAAAGGDEIAVRNNPSVDVAITFSDIDNGPGKIEDAGVRINNPIGFAGGAGNISLDPLFVAGPAGAVYLSEMAAGQAADSPCLDGGSDTAANLGQDTLTTRTDGVTDAGQVNIGYHFEP